MFLDWENRYCENKYTTKSNLQIQCNHYQITKGIFHRTGTQNFMICLQPQKTLNSQSHLEKEKQSWRNKAPWLQTIPQSYSNYVKFWRPWQRKRRIHLTSTILKQIADLIKNLPRRMSVRQKLMKKNCNIKVKVNITCKVQM